LRYPSGAVYEGAVAGGKPDGKGKWLRQNGSYYEGDFAQGLPSGHGKLVSERGIAYEGDFAAGMARGKGLIRFPAGGKMVSYEGSVDDAAPAGTGVLVTKEGRLEGMFEQGEALGDGTFVPARGAAPIRGRWLYGEYEWPAVDKVAFVGGVDADGRRHGLGWCHAVASTQVDACRFRNDRRVALDDASDD
jgi:hypothetical protein